MKILVANRGEIAVRVLRAAAEINVPTVAVFSKDDSNSLHTRMADETYALEKIGVSAYLDIDNIINAAVTHHCNAIHPGYGFLSENAEFARRCKKENIIFIGPSVDCLELFGDKVKARQLAKDC